MNDLYQLDFFREHKILERNDPHTLVCIVCNEVKLIEDFEPDKGGYQGVRRTCISCRTKDRRVRETIRKEVRYPDENHSCPICGTTKDKGLPNPRHRGWVIDHCHTTEKFRAWLCSNCNTGIGLLKDNPKLVRKAAEYLEYHNKVLGITEKEIEDERS